MYNQTSVTAHTKKSNPCPRPHKLRPKAERPKCPVDCLEQERKERYERLKACAPPGFHVVLEKIIRNVVLARPLHIYQFIADLLDAEISRRTFDDIVYGCQLKKSLKRQPYPTESCMIIRNFLMYQARKGLDDSQFLRGKVPQYELTEPALDRYRDYAGIGEFDMSQYEEQTVEEEKSEETPKAEPPSDDTVAFPKLTCVPEPIATPPAVDRYRDFAGIGPFDPDDVEDECFDHRRLGFPKPNCKCMFCMLKAAKSRPASKVEYRKDPCTQPALQTLYIEQPVYREPTYDKERLFKEKEIKAVEPFGAVFRKDDHYKDDGLQPPDPFKEHPIDRDYTADSPHKSLPDDPTEEPVASPDICEELTPQTESCEEVTPSAEDEATSEAKPEITDSGSLCITGEDPFPETGDDPFSTTTEAVKHGVLPTAEKKSEAFSEHTTAETIAKESTQDVQASEAAQEANIEQAAEENVEQAPAAEVEETPEAEAAEPEAKDEIKEEGNAEAAAEGKEEEQAPEDTAEATEA